MGLNEDTFITVGATDKNIAAPCFLTTSAGDYLRSYTLDFEKALSRYQVSHHLLDFSERKDLPHAFSVIDPFRKESIELLEDMSGYFQQFQ